MNCKCSVCNGREPTLINLAGVKTAEDEVIPFFKQDLLKLRYPDHPLPMKYSGLLASIFAYSQALTYDREHSVQSVYHTDNEWMLKFSNELHSKFGMKTARPSELKGEYKLVCEFNTDE